MSTVFVFAVKQRMLDSLFYKYDQFASENDLEDWDYRLVLFLAALIAFLMFFMISTLIIQLYEMIKKI